MSTAACTLLALAALAYVAALTWSLRAAHAERSVGADARAHYLAGGAW